MVLLDALIGDNGLIWLPIAAGVGGLLSTGWILRVRRVVVLPTEVLVYRGDPARAKLSAT